MCRFSVPWADIEDVFTRITEGDPLQGLLLKNEMEGVQRVALKIPADEIDSYLNASMEDDISQRGIGVHLLKMNIRRQHLRDPDTIPSVSSSSVCNGVVVDLMMFSKNERAFTVNKRSVLQNLGASLEMSDKSLNRKLAQIMKRYSSLSKSINKPSGEDAMQKFLHQDDLNEASQPKAPPSRSEAAFTATEQALSGASNTIGALRREVEEATANAKNVTVANRTLAESLREANATTADLQDKLTTLQGKHDTLQKKCATKNEELAAAKTTISTIRNTNFYKRNQRTARKLKAMEPIIHAHQAGACESKARKLRRENKRLEGKLTDARSKLQKQKDEAERKKGQLMWWKMELMAKQS